MASLKEVKDRIASVRNTLKTTSAMKLVASSKLRKVTVLAANMHSYEDHLHGILGMLLASLSADSQGSASAKSSGGERKFSAGAGSSSSARNFSSDEQGLSSEGDAFGEEDGFGSLTAERPLRKAAVVAFSSNSSLCGAFNSNIIKLATQTVSDLRNAGLNASDITVYSIGRKMAEAMKRLGYPSPKDYSDFSDDLSYAEASALAQELLDAFVSGVYDKVILVFNHNKSSSSQVPTVSTFLPISLDREGSDQPQTEGGMANTPAGGRSANMPSGKSAGFSSNASAGGAASSSGKASSGGIGSGRNDFADRKVIVEPSAQELIETLLPKVLRLTMFTTLLDATAAEHSARAIAMQMATDNGNDLLAELTLEYNKGRQSKITTELLDMASGA